MEIFKFENIHVQSLLDNDYFTLDDNMKNIFNNKIPNFLKIEPFSSSINLYSEFLALLGKKRRRDEKIEKKDIKKFIKPNINEDNIDINIQDENHKYFNIEIVNKNKDYFLYKFFKNPKICIPIKEQKIMEINFITTFSELSKIKNKLNGFNIKFLKNDLIQESNDLNIILDEDKEIKKEENNNLIYNNNITNQQVGLMVNNVKVENKNLLFNLGANNTFLFLEKYFCKKIPEEELTYEKVFNDINENAQEISPNILTQKFFDYFTIEKNLRDNYAYYNTKERKIFVKFLNDFMGRLDNIIGISGPKGIGKSATLIYWSCLRRHRVLYINLNIFNLFSTDDIINSLLFECCRFLRNFWKSNEPEIKNMINLIRNYKKSIDVKDFIISLIENVIKSLRVLLINNGCYNICLIFDNFLVDKNSKILIDKIYKMIEYQNLKIVISTTMNNCIIKDYISENILKNNKIFFFDFHFFPRLIGEEVINNNFIKGENIEFVEKFKELGLVPENYYLLKNKNFLSVEFDYNKYIEFDIYNFYSQDSIIFCILELLDFIKSKIYLSSSNLLKYIHIFPFKYVYLTKIKINSSILDKLNYKINKHFYIFKYFSNKTLEKNEEKISSVFHIEEEKDQNQFMDNLNLDYNDYEDEEEKICI